MTVATKAEANLQWCSHTVTSFTLATSFFLWIISSFDLSLAQVALSQLFRYLPSGLSQAVYFFSSHFGNLVTLATRLRLWIAPEDFCHFVTLVSSKKCLPSRHSGNWLSLRIDIPVWLGASVAGASLTARIRVAEWQSGRVTAWQSGRVAEWRSGRVVESEW